MHHNSQVIVALAISTALCVTAWVWARYRLTAACRNTETKHERLRSTLSYCASP
jgi:hypothetical protein